MVVLKTRVFLSGQMWWHREAEAGRSLEVRCQPCLHTQLQVPQDCTMRPCLQKERSLFHLLPQPVLVSDWIREVKTELENDLQQLCNFFTLKKSRGAQCGAAYASNPSTPESGAGGSVRSRSDWAVDLREKEKFKDISNKIKLLRTQTASRYEFFCFFFFLIISCKKPQYPIINQ